MFKVELSPSKKNRFMCFNESPLKMMKNTFYFIFCSEDGRLSKDRRVVHGVTTSGNKWYNE